MRYLFLTLFLSFNSYSLLEIPVYCSPEHLATQTCNEPDYEWEWGDFTSDPGIDWSMTTVGSDWDTINWGDYNNYGGTAQMFSNIAYNEALRATANAYSAWSWNVSAYTSAQAAKEYKDYTLLARNTAVGWSNDALTARNNVVTIYNDFVSSEAGGFLADTIQQHVTDVLNTDLDDLLADTIQQRVSDVLNTDLDDLLEGSIDVASIEANTASSDANTNALAGSKTAIEANTGSLGTNTNALTDGKTAIETNTASSDTNTNALSDSKSAIEANTNALQDLSTSIGNGILGGTTSEALTNALNANTNALNSGGDIGVSDDDGVGWGDSIGIGYIDDMKANLDTLLNNEQQDGSEFQDDFTIQRLTELGGQGSNYGQGGNFAGTGGVCPFSTFSIPAINIYVDTSFLCVYMRAIINLGFAIIIIFSLLFGFKWILKS